MKIKFIIEADEIEEMMNGEDKNWEIKFAKNVYKEAVNTLGLIRYYPPDIIVGRYSSNKKLIFHVDDFELE